MILSDRAIRRELKEGGLSVVPFQDIQIQPASIDFCLGDSFATVKSSETVITLHTPVEYETVTKSTYLLQPHQFVLATTKEYFKIPRHMIGWIEGRSSIGRIGLFIQNAGWVDPGFEGEITLELYNASDRPILLEAGRRVGQMVLAYLDQGVEKPYNGKYQGQTGATGSRIYLDEEFSK